MLVSGKSLALVLSSLFVIATVTMLYVPTVGQAEESTTEGIEGIETTERAESSHSSIQIESNDASKRRATAEFPHALRFEKGAFRFAPGDSITVLEIRGTAETFEPGNRYWIRGTYTLASRDKAALSAFITAKDAADGKSPISPLQTTQVNRGQGTFELVLPMSYRGWPHVSFYPAEGGDGFGGIYFGTGDSVLKQWWGTDEVADPSAGTSPPDASELIDVATTKAETNSPDGIKRTNDDKDISEILRLFKIDNDNVVRTRKYKLPAAFEALFPELPELIETLEELPAQYRFSYTLEQSGTMLQVYATEAAQENYFQKRISDWKATHDRARMFPTLEEQKLADLAWKRLGLELEPIGQEDMAKVKALGYEGGVKVSMGGSADWNDIQMQDILVGLHVWPTTSLGDVADVLGRDDLPKLNPLKFYVVRPGRKETGAFRSGPEEDTVVTGRIEVALPDTISKGDEAGTMFRSGSGEMGRGGYGEMGRGGYGMMGRGGYGEMSRGAEPKAANEPHTSDSTTDPAAASQQITAPGKYALRYDGKTFQDWRLEWSNKQSLEALTAMAAFAAAGYGEEAAAAIVYGAYSNVQPVPQHARKYLHELSEDNRRAVVSGLIGDLKTELSARRRIAAIRALAAIGPPAESALEILKERLASDNPQERIAAAAAIKMIVGKDQYQKPLADVLGEELGIKAVKTDPGVWAVLPRDDVADVEAFNKFNDAVIKEQEILFPPADRPGGGVF